jgi:L-alanine-DL-glutamate epimerase-like enolase superfamily enzyme
MKIQRREFLAGLAGTALLPAMTWAKQAPKDIKITRVVSFELELTRPKHIGKNAYRHDHGLHDVDRVVRIYTNAGIDGFGTCWSGANECAALLGKNPFDFFHADKRKVISPLERYTTPIWDLAGKILKKPVYELLGGAVREKVPAYDGSIYFTDLRPQFRNSWRDEFKRELDQSMAAGHRAFKIKIGRGNIWMRREKGYARDVEVCQHIRQHVGPDIMLAADANDGHTIQSARQFMADTADLKFAFVEEMFPQESAANYLAFKKYIRQLGLDTLIADGENKHGPKGMKEWVNAEAVDILQADMNLLGFEDILAEAAMAQPHGIQIAPHNWGSLFGYYLQLQVGKAVPNFYRAEEDPLSTPAVDTSAYKLSNGEATVPDMPGLGLKLIDEALPKAACVHFDLKA